MYKSAIAVLSIVGTVIGSGFLSGKEIVVFFSRFGILSFPCIVFACLFFYLLFIYFLQHGDKFVQKFEKSKLFCVFNLIIAIIISSAMFAGCDNSLPSVEIKWIFFIIVIFISILITRKGLSGLGKINFVLVPIMIGVVVFCLFSKIDFEEKLFIANEYSIFSIFYAVLYVFFNISTSILLISKLGQTLSDKQKVRVGIISALALCVILLIANFLLLQNVHAFGQDMPLLFLFDGARLFVMRLVILLGCVTTLFSLVYTSSNCLRGLCKNDFFIVLISVFLPFAISFWGFGNIVSFLYPLSSMLSLMLLGYLFVVPLFKRAYTKIHSSRKHTK